MNVHLIRSEAVSDALFFGVRDLLTTVPGPYHFITHEEHSVSSISEDRDEFETGRFAEKSDSTDDNTLGRDTNTLVNQAVPWKRLFSLNYSHRELFRIPEEEPVILLTERGNEKNWFSGFDTTLKRNFFIHTKPWEYYIDGDIRFPVTYQLASLLLMQELFTSPIELIQALHDPPKGCMMDFCKVKADVTLKLRTADICPACLEKIRMKVVRPDKIHYIFQLIEDIRRQLLHRDRFVVLQKPMGIRLNSRRRQVCIPGLGNLKISLSPTEFALYMLFLDHPDGIRLVEMIDHRTELLNYMNQVSRWDDQDAVTRMTDELCRADSDALSIKLSKIKSKFTKLLGNALAEPYIISGPNGGNKTILLSRELVAKET